MPEGVPASVPLIVWSRVQPRRAGSGGAELLAFKRIPNLMCTQRAVGIYQGIYAARAASLYDARGSTQCNPLY